MARVGKALAATRFSSFVPFFVSFCCFLFSSSFDQLVFTVRNPHGGETRCKIRMMEFRLPCSDSFSEELVLAQNVWSLRLNSAGAYDTRFFRRKGISV